MTGQSEDISEAEALHVNSTHFHGRISTLEEEAALAREELEEIRGGEWLPTPVAYLIIGQIVTTGALVGWVLGKYLRDG